MSGTKVITYDNERSIADKVRFAMEKGLAGAMVWSIDTDDFQGDCSDDEQFVNFPLMRGINKAITQALEDIKNSIIKEKVDDKAGTASSISARTGLAAVIAIFLYFF